MSDADAVVPVQDERYRVLQTFHLAGVDVDLCVDVAAVQMVISVGQDILSNPILMVRKV